MERCFSSAVVEKLMSSFKLIRILLLQWLFAHCFSGAADLGWGRVLRTPTSPFALKGECHKFSVSEDWRLPLSRFAQGFVMRVLRI